MPDKLRTMLTPRSVHLCIDMQLLFTEAGPWPTPWMRRVAPVVVRLVAHAPQRTVFTRFLTPERAEDLPGAWRRFYAKWADATRARIAPPLLDLIPELAAFAPPAQVIDKTRYSAFAYSALSRHLHERQADALIITGSETDVCVLATVLDAVDRGYPVIVVTDAVCSGSDEGHDHLLGLYRQRFSEQIETAESAAILEAWR